MNKILTAAALMLAIPPIAAQTPGSAPLPQAPAPSSHLPQAPRIPKNDLKALTVDASGETWGSLDDTTRYLLIMGTADGFAAAGPGSPCFPGMNNTGIDGKLKEAGFASRDPRELPTQMKAISADAETCQSTGRRGYALSLLKGMPDAHLATYLTGMVRGYAAIHPCASTNQARTAAAVAIAIFAGPDDGQPSETAAPALRAGCADGPSS